jgi:hypothetical protein
MERLVKITGKLHISWENPRFTVKIFPTNPAKQELPVKRTVIYQLGIPNIGMTRAKLMGHEFQP